MPGAEVHAVLPLLEEHLDRQKIGRFFMFFSALVGLGFRV